MKKKLLFITNSQYPDNTAMYVRYHTLAKLFQYVGYDVLILSRGSYTKREVSMNDGIRFFSVSAKSQNVIQKGIDIKFRIYHYMKKILSKDEFAIVLVTGTDLAILKYLKEYCAKKKILLLSDCVEWYSPSQFAKGCKDKTYQQKEYWMTKGIDDRVSTISISSYFQNYFADRRINTIRIPVIMDMKTITVEKKLSEDKIIIVYAGSPGRKDYLKEVVEGYSLLEKEERIKLQIRLIGIDKSQLCSHCGIDKNIIASVADGLVCFGRIPRTEVLENLQEANFTILIRPVLARYAQAGFPTKVVESLASGTPVISNLTSDLGMYLKDMENAVVVSGCSSEEVRDALKKVASTTFQERITMCRNARKSAEQNFDYRKYAESLSIFLKDSMA